MARGSCDSWAVPTVQSRQALLPRKALTEEKSFREFNVASAI